MAKMKKQPGRPKGSKSTRMVRFGDLKKHTHDNEIIEIGVNWMKNKGMIGKPVDVVEIVIVKPTDKTLVEMKDMDLT